MEIRLLISRVNLHCNSLPFQGTQHTPQENTDINICIKEDAAIAVLCMKNKLYKETFVSMVSPLLQDIENLPSHRLLAIFGLLSTLSLSTSESLTSQLKQHLGNNIVLSQSINMKKDFDVLQLEAICKVLSEITLADFLQFTIPNQIFNVQTVLSLIGQYASTYHICATLSRILAFGVTNTVEESYESIIRIDNLVLSWGQELFTLIYCNIFGFMVFNEYVNFDVNADKIYQKNCKLSLSNDEQLKQASDYVKTIKQESLKKKKRKKDKFSTTPPNPIEKFLVQNKHLEHLNANNLLKTIQYLTVDIEKNDVSLEIGLALPRMHTAANSKIFYEPTHGVIYAPSAYLLEYIVTNSLFPLANLTIVVPNEHLAAALSLCSQFNERNIEFFALQDWLNAVALPSYQWALCFCTSIESADMQILWDKLQAGKNNVEFWAMMNSTPSTWNLHDATLFSIDLFTAQLKESTYPKKKTFVHGILYTATNYCADIEIPLLRFRQPISGQPVFLIRDTDEPIYIMHSQLFSNSSTLREFYHQEQRLRPSEKQRNAAEIYSFTEELNICFRLFMYTDKPLTVEAYICGPGVPGASKDLVFRNKIPSTNKRKAIYDISKLKSWLENGYPDSSLKKVSIRDSVIEVYRPFYNGKPITWKTLHYLYPELQTYVTEKQYKIIYAFMSTPIGDLKTNATFEELCLAVDEALGEFDDLEGKVAWDAVAALLEFSKQWNHGTTDIPEADINEKVTRTRNRKAEVAAALTKKSLTTPQMKSIFSIIMEKLKNPENIIYIGLLIRLLTGLPASIVCALRWSDLDILVKSENLYKLKIYRKLDPESKQNTTPLTALYQVRTIPICRTLARILLEYQQLARESYGATISEHAFKQLPIVTSAKIISSGTIETMVSTSDLNCCGKITLAEIGFTANTITLMDDDTTEILDLSSYKGDFFRRNYLYLLSFLMHCPIDIVNHMLGRAPSSVLADHYVDYNSTRVQRNIANHFTPLDDMLTISAPKEDNIHFISKEGTE